MRRAIAILLGIAMVSAFGSTPALHIHAYGDHDHPGHDHGPAIHGHDAIATHHDDEAVRVEGCDPSRHVLRWVLVSGAASSASVLAAVCAGPVVALRDNSSEHATHLRDVRVHGPPPRSEAPPRAPPLSISA